MEPMTVLGVLLVLLAVLYLWPRRAGPPLPPGPALPTFIRGSRLDAQAFLQLQQRFGDVVSVRVLGDLYVFLNSHDAVRQAFVSQGQLFTGRPENAVLNCTQPGFGLIFTEGQLWQVHRRFLLGVLKDFGFGKLGAESIVQQELLCLRSRLQAAAQDGPVSTQEFVSVAVSNVICSLVFGEQCSLDAEFRPILHMINECGEHISPMVLALSKYVKFLKWIPGDPLYVRRLMQSMVEIDEYVGRKLEQHKRTFDSSKPRDYIDMYLIEMQQNRHLFSESQLRRIIFELFVAGMDSTATMLNWSIYFMAQHPDIQQKVHEEIDSVLGNHSVPSMADKSKLKYTTAVLCEVQRCAILVPFGGARRPSRDTVIGGYRIPKNAIVSAPQLTAHKDPRVWPHPVGFHPENFIDPESLSLRNSEYLVTFSMGKRNCLGESLANQELFIFFVGLLQKFEILARSVPVADERFFCLPERRPPAFTIDLRTRN